MKNLIFQEERIKESAKYIKSNGRATVEELCAKFSVSPATIRRDLSLIEKNITYEELTVVQYTCALCFEGFIKQCNGDWWY